MTDVPQMLAGLAPLPQLDFAEFGSVTVEPISRIQSLTGRFLGRNWVSIPHVTHHDDADVSEMEARRQLWNAEHPDTKLTPVVLLVKVLAQALVALPQFNVSIDAGGGKLVRKRYYNVGVAVDTPQGLVVPVIRGVDAKSLVELAAELKTVSEKARAKGLSMTEMSGGCVTLSSLGHIGGTAFTPIINAPDVAILGVTRTRPVAVPGPSGEVVWRQMLPLSLSYDHRVINGADAARFTRFVAACLADPSLFEAENGLAASTR